MDKRSNQNKWVVEQPGKDTGLVHPETREEAESEMARLGISGNLITREEFEAGDRHKGTLLADQRVFARIAIESHARTLLDSDIETVRHILALGVPIKQESTDIMTKVDAKSAFVASATKKQLDAFDPTADW